MKIINVISHSGGSILGITSFHSLVYDENSEGRLIKAAESHMVDLIKEHDPEISDEEAQECAENQSYSDGDGYDIIRVWSDLVEEVKGFEEGETITEKDFYENFKPVINHIERAKHEPDVADEDICGFSGCLFETFGEDIQYLFELNKTEPNRIWTIEWDEDFEERYPDKRLMLIMPGFDPEADSGYLVTEQPWTNPGLYVEEILEMNN